MISAVHLYSDWEALDLTDSATFVPNCSQLKLVPFSGMSAQSLVLVSCTHALWASLVLTMSCQQSDPIRQFWSSKADCNCACKMQHSSGSFVCDMVMWLQWARSVSGLKLLETTDPMYAWRARVFALYPKDFDETLGYPV